MGVSRDERLARNESFFRDINERIAEVADEHGSDGHVYEFICECGDPTCTERVSLTTVAYESIRADAQRFVLVPGHDLAEIEAIVSTTADHVVVEKFGVAGQVAEALNPRTA